MNWLAIWFVALSIDVTGYVPPQGVTLLRCGRPGAVVGIRVNRLLNPTLALWPDPFVADQHCEESIVARVAALAAGEYELATTEMGELNAAQWTFHIDPHVSERWRRDEAPMATMRRPTGLRVR